jgi:hypothetical protein
MRVFNRFKFSREASYIVIDLGFSTSQDADDLGPETERFTLPITTATSLAMALFDATIRSTADLTAFFAALAEPMAKLNQLSVDIDKKKADIATFVGATTSEGQGKP